MEFLKTTFIYFVVVGKREGIEETEGIRESRASETKGDYIYIYIFFFSCVVDVIGDLFIYFIL